MSYYALRRHWRNHVSAEARATVHRRRRGDFNATLDAASAGLMATPFVRPKQRPNGRRAVRPGVDPRQQLLHLKETQGIVTVRRVKVGHVEIDEPILGHEAGDQCDDVTSLIVQIADPICDKVWPNKLKVALHLIRAGVELKPC